MQSRLREVGVAVGLDFMSIYIIQNEMDKTVFETSRDNLRRRMDLSIDRIRTTVFGDMYINSWRDRMNS